MSKSSSGLMIYILLVVSGMAIAALLWSAETASTLEHYRLFASSSRRKTAISTSKSMKSLGPSLDTTSIPNKDSKDLLQELKEKHPVCFSSTLFAPKQDTNASVTRSMLQPQVFHLNNSTARFVRVHSEDNQPPRYSIHSCAVMKTRYNCATNDGEATERATDWKLVLHPPKMQQLHQMASYCDLRALADDLDGPVGLAKILKSRVRNSAASQHRPLNLVLFGNSMLRQVWEAFTCGWRHQLTSIRAQMGGRAQMRGHVVRASAMGETVQVPLPPWNATTVGCHSYKDADNRRFYRSGITLPKTLDSCNDNIAVSDFGGKIRIFYVYRPFLFENVSDIYNKLELDPDEIDHFVFSQLFEDSKFFGEEIGGREVIDRSSLWPRRTAEMLGDISQRDIGKWWGASNPGIAKPPDIHPCMPGIPDDEANLLLFLILNNAILRFGRGGIYVDS